LVLSLIGASVQDALKDQVGPVQLSDGHDHIHQLALAIPVLDGGEQDLLLFCQLPKLMSLS